MEKTLILEKAKKMMDEGITIFTVAKMLGIDKSYLYYHFSPKARKRILDRTRKWQMENPEAVKKINQKASKKFNKNHKHPCRDCPKLVWQESERCQRCYHRSQKK